MHSPRRSVFVDRLKEHASFARGDDDIYAARGQWADFFRERIGPEFGGRVILEIGSADGDFLCRLAAAHPAIAFVGIDWKARSVFNAAQRVHRQGLQNVALRHGRGHDLMRIFGPGEINEILLLHPDPCAVPHERANRLFNLPFLLDAHRVLKNATSTLTLKTDHPGYYAWALALLGMDEPARFAAARAAAIADPKLATRLAGEPPVRASDLLPLAERPPPAPSVCGSFKVALASENLWHDPAAIGNLATRLFANEKTLFEHRFLRKRQPIYYLELQKRWPA